MDSTTADAMEVEHPPAEQATTELSSERLDVSLQNRVFPLPFSLLMYQLEFKVP